MNCENDLFEILVEYWHTHPETTDNIVNFLGITLDRYSDLVMCKKQLHLEVF